MKILFLLSLFFLANPVLAQSNKFFDNTKNVTLDYIDTPIRTALEQLLKQGNVKNYYISNDVEGFVTLKLNDQTFENALKIVMRANNVPLLYKIENEILIIEKRKESIIIQKQPDVEIEKNDESAFEIIPLNFIDPLDLQSVFGQILYVRQFTRYSNFNNNNQNNNNQNNSNNNNQNRNNSNNRRNRRNP